MATKPAVNLIPQEEIQKRRWEKFLSWVLTYGRYVIVGTEVVLLLVLLVRFKLDRDLANLSDQVEAKQTMIESFGDLEKKTRSLQTHLATIKTFQEQNPSRNQIISGLSLLTPQDVTFSQLKVSSSKVTLSATAFSLPGFSVFLEGLKHSREFSNLSLEKVGKGKSGIEFTLSFNYQEK